mmetsp:Transcript_524/g.664  ORF Transcript_524/g.664 Transcript_524/m.664 type:complete len:87 (+) Transcript_524:682-942(+)
MIVFVWEWSTQGDLLDHWLGGCFVGFDDVGKCGSGGFVGAAKTPLLRWVLVRVLVGWRVGKVTGLKVNWAMLFPYGMVIGGDKERL